MKKQNLKRSAGLLCLLAAAFWAGQAKADSYSVYRVSYNSGSVRNVGLTDDGSLTTYSFSSMNYSTFSPTTGTTTTSSTLPPLVFDNGKACGLSIQGVTGIKNAICNNGYVVFDADTPNSIFSSLYLFADHMVQQLYVGSAENVLLNGKGDVAFVGSALKDADTNFLYRDLTSRMAPEPESLLMVLSGCGAITGMVRRRKSGSQE